MPRDFSADKCSSVSPHPSVCNVSMFSLLGSDPVCERLAHRCKTSGNLPSFQNLQGTVRFLRFKSFVADIRVTARLKMPKSRALNLNGIRQVLPKISLNKSAVFASLSKLMLPLTI